MEILLILIAIAIFVFVIYTLVDVIKSNFANDTNKIIWVLVILFLAPIGSVIYMISGKKQKIKN